MFGIDDAIDAGIKLVTDVIDKVFPDPAVAAQAKIQLLQLQQSGELAKITANSDLMKLLATNDTAQIDLNKTEATGSFWQSGWRPMIAWTCAVAFAWNYVFNPVSAYILIFFNLHISIVAPFDMSVMAPVMFGILGLGTMRSAERISGVK